MAQKIIYSHKLYNSWQKRGAGQLKQEHERVDYILVMYNSECKNSGDIVCFLYVEHIIIKGYTFIMIGLQETFIGGWGLIETLDNKKQSEEGKRGRQKGAKRESVKN